MGMKPLVITERMTKRDTHSFKFYLSEIDKIERLTTDEEYNVAIRAFKGDEAAREELVVKNLRFVISVAKQYLTKGVTLEDLVNEGNYGLIKAAERFDPTKGFKFISYAVWWIRRNIIEYLTKNSRTIKVSANKVALVKPITELVEQLQQKLGRDPSEGEIIDIIESETNYSQKDIEYYLSIDFLKLASLDKPFDDDGGSLIDTIVGDDFPNTDHLVDKNGKELYAKQLLGLLKNDSQRTVIVKLFGLDGEYAMELKEVAEHMDLSRERVRQIRDNALRLLRGKSRDLNLHYMFEY